LGRWLRRHPFSERCLLLGGVGLIVDPHLHGALAWMASG
jgi:hypothetical protein